MRKYLRSLLILLVFLAGPIATQEIPIDSPDKRPSQQKWRYMVPNPSERQGLQERLKRRHERSQADLERFRRNQEFERRKKLIIGLVAVALFFGICGIGVLRTRRREKAEDGKT